MNWDAAFVIILWVTFLFVWLPRKFIRYRKKMASVNAICKGYQFGRRYKAIRDLSGRPS